MHLARNARSQTDDGAALAGPPDARGCAASLPPAGAQFEPWGGLALNVPPTLAASPLRCPPRGRDSRLGAALRRSTLPPRSRLRRVAAPRGGAIRALGRPCGAHTLRSSALPSSPSGRTRITARNRISATPSLYAGET